MLVTLASVKFAIPGLKSIIETEPSGSTVFVIFGSPSFAVKIFVNVLLKVIMSGIAPTATCLINSPLEFKKTTEPFACGSIFSIAKATRPLFVVTELIFP